ncbi:hypothetical protein AAFF_G00430650 [Aldrovandia affinis]|uniref:Uncharacterized protein n=1 Tax=Aldrovandia affinis TaxID=143900 RepID=A0AAD7S8Z3_9TELE|nr:hypothetical protein AAFF_G00430650 [Aldrovandia affinis]
MSGSQGCSMCVSGPPACMGPRSLGSRGAAGEERGADLNKLPRTPGLRPTTAASHSTRVRRSYTADPTLTLHCRAQTSEGS